MFFGNFKAWSCQEKKRNDNPRYARDAEFRMLIQHLFSIHQPAHPKHKSVGKLYGKIYSTQNEYKHLFHCSKWLQHLTRVSCVSKSNSSNTTPWTNTWLEAIHSLLHLPPLAFTFLFFSKPEKSLLLLKWRVSFFPLQFFFSVLLSVEKEKKGIGEIFFESFVYDGDKVIAARLTICSC